MLPKTFGAASSLVKLFSYTLFSSISSRHRRSSSSLLYSETSSSSLSTTTTNNSRPASAVHFQSVELGLVITILLLPCFYLLVHSALLVVISGETVDHEELWPFQLPSLRYYIRGLDTQAIREGLEQHVMQPNYD